MLLHSNLWRCFFWTNERHTVLKTTIIHPELVQALAEAGHGARVLLADSNYAPTVNVNPSARIVFLNFTAGCVGGLDIVRALSLTIPIESAVYMAEENGGKPAIIGEYEKLLPGVPVEGRSRFDFYEMAKADDTCLVIASGETTPRANLLMTVGVVGV